MYCVVDYEKKQSDSRNEKDEMQRFDHHDAFAEREMRKREYTDAAHNGQAEKKTQWGNERHPRLPIEGLNERFH